jgi:hypothetical protein
MSIRRTNSGFGHHLHNFKHDRNLTRSRMLTALLKPPALFLLQGLVDGLQSIDFTAVIGTIF